MANIDPARSLRNNLADLQTDVKEMQKLLGAHLDVVPKMGIPSLKKVKECLSTVEQLLWEQFNALPPSALTPTSSPSARSDVLQPSSLPDFSDDLRAGFVQVRLLVFSVAKLLQRVLPRIPSPQVCISWQQQANQSMRPTKVVPRRRPSLVHVNDAILPDNRRPSVSHMQTHGRRPSVVHGNGNGFDIMLPNGRRPSTVHIDEPPPSNFISNRRGSTTSHSDNEGWRRRLSISVPNATLGVGGPMGAMLDDGAAISLWLQRITYNVEASQTCLVTFRQALSCFDLSRRFIPVNAVRTLQSVNNTLFRNHFADHLDVGLGSRDPMLRPFSPNEMTDDVVPGVEKAATAAEAEDVAEDTVKGWGKVRSRMVSIINEDDLFSADVDNNNYTPGNGNGNGYGQGLADDLDTNNRRATDQDKSTGLGPGPEARRRRGKRVIEVRLTKLSEARMMKALAQLQAQKKSALAATAQAAAAAPPARHCYNRSCTPCACAH